MLSVLFNVILSLLDSGILLVSYITNGESFPEPLSEEAEKDYLRRYKQGEEEVESILVEHNLRLVAYIAKKYNSSGMEQEDFISTGTIGLMKAIKTFDSSKGIKLSSYAARCIENEILMEIRSAKKKSREVSIYDIIGTDKDGNEICLLDILGTEPDLIADEVHNNITTKNLYKKIATVLKDKDRMIIQMRYGLVDGKRKTQKEVAEVFGISRSYISRIEKKIIKILREELHPRDKKY